VEMQVTFKLRCWGAASMETQYQLQARNGAPTPAPTHPTPPPMQVGRQFCTSKWADVAAAHANELQVEQYCFRAPYVQALLLRGLGLQEEQVKIGESARGKAPRGEKGAGGGGGGGLLR
jgi:hypothetical protein